MWRVSIEKMTTLPVQLIEAIMTGSECIMGTYIICILHESNLHVTVVKSKYGLVIKQMGNHMHT